MTVLYDGVIAFLAAVGLTALLWLLAGLVLRRREKDVEAVLLLPVRGEAAHLEYDVQALLALRPRLGRYTPVLIVDCGLSEESRLRAAILEKNYNCVTVVAPAQITEHVT